MKISFLLGNYCYICYVITNKKHLHFVSRKPLQDFWEKNPIAEEPLKAFFKICSDTTWKKPNDMFSEFGVSNCDQLGKNRYAIDVKGNNIRVILIIRFSLGRIFCLWVGWHKDYERIDVKKITYKS